MSGCARFAESLEVTTSISVPVVVAYSAWARASSAFAASNAIRAVSRRSSAVISVVVVTVSLAIAIEEQAIPAAIQTAATWFIRFIFISGSTFSVSMVLLLPGLVPSAGE